MAKNLYWATSLTGGGAGALDGIVDGDELADLDGAVVITLTYALFYSLDADSGASESSPTVIAPDVNPGDKRWILTGISEISAAAMKQLKNIGATEISAAQWGYLGAMNQGIVIGSVPIFLAMPTAQQSDLAVDTDVTIAFGTEHFDIGGNFAANTFTAPVTGKYLLSMNIILLNLDSAAAYYQISIITTARNYAALIDPSKFSGDITHWSFPIIVPANMAASETAFVRFYQSGGAAQTDVDISSFFGGALIG